MNNQKPTIISAPSLTEAQLLATHFLDASFYLPNAPQDADAIFLANHLPGAQRFDIDRIADQSNDYPHMLPSADSFTKIAQTLGLSSDSAIICYEQAAAMGAARAWWMLRVFGHDEDKLQVLDAGWDQSPAIASQASSARPTNNKGNFVATFRPELVADKAMVLRAIHANQEAQATHTQIIDARAADRFAGTTPEPRAGLRSGHMPTAINLPFKACYDGQGRWRSPEALAQLMKTAGIDPKKPTITTCGSGVTACVIALALYQLGNKTVRVYDGSWSEWGANHDLPIAMGQ